MLLHASSLEVVYKLATMLFVILKPHPLFVESSAVKICHSGQKLQHQQNSTYSIYQALLSLSPPPSCEPGDEASSTPAAGSVGVTSDSVFAAILTQ